MTFSPNFESSLSSPVTDDFVSLSRRFYADEGLRADLASPSRQASAEPAELILDDPFATLSLTSAEANAASGSRADFKMVEGSDGKAQLIKIGEGDPLADGKLDIELETGDRSVKEAILAADQAVKQYYRELIAAFQASHPGQDYPSWWNDILQSQPETGQNQNQNVSQERPQSQAQFQPQTQTQNPFMDRLNSLMGPYNPDYSGIYPGSDIPRGATSFIPQDQPMQPDQPVQPDTQTSGISSNVDSQTLLNNVRTVVDVAERHGVDPNLAVAMMLVESGGDNRAVGDGGTSFGLFQLHRGGMLTEAGLSRDQAFDPRVNAEVSIGHLAEIDQNYADPGRAAAASQRPAHPQEYARRVNANLDDAARLVAMASQSGGNQGIA
ncbi:MAG: transglycosylase SLT domain-containing protein [Cyanobacteria bacterium HKST-UBA02]|nr:transglycosylase SLT domain-containing protein [Cyanobacteria bacterium HKST-UBA02]